MTPLVVETTITTSSSSSSEESAILVRIWELPEILIYLVTQFVSPPTKRASFVCHTLAVLCKSAYRSILVTNTNTKTNTKTKTTTNTKENDNDDVCSSMELWDLILRGDYGIERNTQHYYTDEGRRQQQRRRSSKRLKRSPVQQVKEAHKAMILNTEMAYSMIGELTSSSSSSSNKNILTKHKMVQILNEYGPNLMLNRTMASGGNFLVEICRCRNSSVSTILRCVRELVRRGASEVVNRATHESRSSSLTALCVAAVRGMPQAVKYLLSIMHHSNSAVHDIQCSGRFRLQTNPKKTMHCLNATPLVFSEQMRKAEQEAGATHQELKELEQCITLLKGT